MGLSKEQLEFEIQKILYQGDQALIIYALQVALEYRIILRREIIENLIKKPSEDEAIVLFQYFEVLQPSKTVDYCLKLIEQFPGTISDLAIRTLISTRTAPLNELQAKQLLKLISHSEDDNQTAKMITKLHGIAEQLPLKWFTTISRHRSLKVRLQVVKLIALNTRETFRQLLSEASTRNDQCKPWALVGLWKLGDPGIIQFVHENPRYTNLLAYCGSDPEIISTLQNRLKSEYCIEAATALKYLKHYESLHTILNISLEKAGSLKGLCLFHIAEGMDSELSLNTLQHAIELQELSAQNTDNVNRLNRLALGTCAAFNLARRIIAQPIPQDLKQAIQINQLTHHERWLAPLLWSTWSNPVSYANGS